MYTIFLLLPINLFLEAFGYKINVNSKLLRKVLRHFNTSKI